MKRKVWKNKSVLRLIEETNCSDPIEAIRNKAREVVLSAFEKGWSGPPFDPFKLARLIGISIFPNETVSEARILTVEGKSKIEYNPLQRPTRINFSVSHEIGHFLFSDWQETVRNREEEKIGDLWELEFLCDVAASEILLPYAEFAQEANSSPLNLNALLDIARKYQASLEAVFLRFAQVVNKPCGVLIAFFDNDEKQSLTVKYFKPSAFIDIDLEPGVKIPVWSKAYECKNPGWTAEAVESWDYFDGQKLKIYVIGLPPVKKDKRGRVGIFIAPEEYDERPAKDIYTVNGDATIPRGEGKKIIVQVVNTTGAVGFGFGRSMAEKWPASRKALNSWKGSDDFKIGESRLTQLAEDIFVYQILAQKGIRPKHDGETIFSYIGLQRSLEELRSLAKDIMASIHMPMIGAGQARGDWNTIRGIIYDELVQHDLDVTVYVRPNTRFNPKNNSPLNLFGDS